MITYEDWRDAPAPLIARLLDAECARWKVLGWDYRGSCGMVEAARHEGRLPGLLARDDQGRVVGWSYYVLHDGTFQIGTLLGDSDGVVRGLLAAILDTPDARRARTVSCFLFPNLPTAGRALEQQRFDVGWHAYMRRDLPGAATPSRRWLRRRETPAPPRVEPWTPRDTPETVALLAGAYAGTLEERWFAPNGQLQEWTRYLTQVMHTPACGRFDPTLTMTARTDRGEVAGAVIVTVLGDRTAHIAQVAVARAHRRRGLGERLVRLACDRAHAAGHARLTLLVDESNQVARRLYARLGFDRVTRFLFGIRSAS